MPKNLRPKSRKQGAEIPSSSHTDNTEENLNMSRVSNKDKKTSLYVEALQAAEKLDFEAEDNVDSIDDEIKLMRIKIKSLLMNEKQDIKLIMQATKIVAKLVEERYNMSKGQNKGLTGAIKNLIKDVGLPVGVAMINKKLGND